jgi:hypothetical protein
MDVVGFAPEVDDHLLRLGDVQLQEVAVAPVHQLADCLSVLGLIRVAQKSREGCVVGELDLEVAGIRCSAVGGLDGEEDWRQHATLGRSCVGHHDVGEDGTDPDLLWPGRHEAVDP